jgi:hypothetical protein
MTPSQSILATRTSEALNRIAARQELPEPQQMFLPGLDGGSRAMPNHVARSSLFSPIARGRKIHHEQVVLVSRSDATITYTGKQLDEAQADVWMQLMFEAKDAFIGQAAAIGRAAFLRAIGRGTGGAEYKWLHRTFFEFTAAVIVIETRVNGMQKYRLGHMKAFHMLSNFEYDPNLETYLFTIDARWKTLFGGREYALIDWSKRLLISQGQDMAKALQRLVATSADPVQRYALNWLKDKLQYSSPMRKFRKALSSAMEELERVGVIAAGRLEFSTKGKEQAAWTKLVSTGK